MLSGIGKVAFLVTLSLIRSRVGQASLVETQTKKTYLDAFSGY